MVDNDHLFEPRLREAVSQLNAAQARLIELVAEAAETGVWEGVGIRSLAHYLTWQAGLSSRSARELVRIAEARHTHPVVSRLLSAGRLTLDQTAVAITAPVDVEAQVAEMAPCATVAQLRVIVRAAGKAASTPGEPPAESFTRHIDETGRMHGSFKLDADHGAVVDAALAAARDRLFAAGATTVTWVDAMVEMAQRSLDAETVERRERFRINLFLDPVADQAARWTNGIAIPDEIRRHLGCDGTFVPAFVEQGRAVSVGRAQRIVPDRTRRTVMHRDGGCCRAPWCANDRWLHVHHIVHWEDGGRTDTANLCALCPACHRAHHRGRFAISGDADQPDGLRFTAPDGIDITRPPPPLDPPMPPPPARSRYEHPVGERLRPHDLHFHRPDTPAWAA